MSTSSIMLTTKSFSVSFFICHGCSSVVVHIQCQRIAIAHYIVCWVHAFSHILRLRRVPARCVGSLARTLLTYLMHSRTTRTTTMTSIKAKMAKKKNVNYWMSRCFAMHLPSAPNRKSLLRVHMCCDQRIVCFWFFRSPRKWSIESNS